MIAFEISHVLNIHIHRNLHLCKHTNALVGINQRQGLRSGDGHRTGDGEVLTQRQLDISSTYSNKKEDGNIPGGISRTR